MSGQLGGWLTVASRMPTLVNPLVIEMRRVQKLHKVPNS